MFLLVSDFVLCANYNLNFTLQTQNYFKNYTQLASFSEFPLFSDIEFSSPNSIYYLNDKIFYAMAFYKNTSGSFDSGWYGIYKPNLYFKNGFPSGYLNKSLLYMEQFSLVSGTSLSFVLLDLKLNQSVYTENNKTNVSVFFNVIDRQSGITDYFNLVFLNGNNIKYSQQYLLPNSTDRYNYTIIIIPNSSFYFDRFIIRQSVNIESGVVQDLGIGEINFNNIGLEQNQLPQANITINDNKFICINNSETSKEIPINISVFDKENDIVYYSYLDTNYNYINKTIKYNVRWCLIGGICRNEIANDVFSNVYYRGENDNEYCEVKPYSFLFEYPPSYYIFSNTNTKINNQYVYMLDLNYQTCSYNNKNFYYAFENTIENLVYKTKIYDFDTNLEQFNISFYTDGFTRLKTFSFWLRDNVNITIYESRTLTGGLNILGAVSDYNTSLEITIVNGLLTLKQDNNIDFFNYSTYLNESYKFVGLNIFPTTTIKQNDFTFSGVNQNLIYTTQQLNNITIYSIGNYKIKFYLSDSVNLENNKYNIVEKEISVVSCDSLYINDGYSPSFTAFLKTSNSAYFGICSGVSVLFNNFANNILGNVNLNFCIFFYWLYFIVTLIIFIGLGAWIYLQFGNSVIAFGFSAVAFSMSNFLLYPIFLFGLGFQFLYSFIFAVGLVSLIIGFFANSGNG